MGRNAPLAVAIAAAIVVLGVLALHLYVHAVPGVQTVDDLSVDARFRIRGTRPPASDRVVIVGIDDQTRAKFPELMQTRRGYAALVRALTKYDVKVIAFDLFFSSPEELLPHSVQEEVIAAADQSSTDPKLLAVITDVAKELRGDDELTSAIAESHRVFLGAFFVPGAGQAATEPKQLITARHGETADANAGGPRRPVHAIAVDFTLEKIAAGAIGAGAINDFRDPDGVRRRMPVAIELGAHQYMPMGLAVAMFDRKQSTRYVVGDDHLEAGDEAIPLATAASLWLDVMGHDQLPRISAGAIMDGTAPKSALAGKLAFVGLTFATYDKVATSLDPVADGIELHATLAENILSGHLLRVASPATTLAITLVLLALVSATFLRPVRRRAWVPPIVAVAAVTIYLV
ncbi:MAG TPA: CHASE2 domain-containing protein, partial [Kofleriaceae bacterium]